MIILDIFFSPKKRRHPNAFRSSFYGVLMMHYYCKIGWTTTTGLPIEYPWAWRVLRSFPTVAAPTLGLLIVDDQDLLPTEGVACSSYNLNTLLLDIANLFIYLHCIEATKVILRLSVDGRRLQVYSYYKMISWFCVPQPSLEGTTGPNWLKFCMGPPRGWTRGLTEGFLEIRSGGLDMGYPRGLVWGAKNFEIFFLHFFHLF